MRSEHQHLDRLPVREQRQRPITIFRKPIAEFLEQIASGLRMFATRRNDIGMPLAIFLSSRSRRIAKALVPKYSNLESDPTTATTRAGSLGGVDSRSIRSSNTSDVCCALR
jgi:hypothetical protein